MSSGEEGELHGDGSEAGDQQDLEEQQSLREKTSSKKKTILVRDGYEYGFDKMSRSDPNLEFYRCIFRGPTGKIYCPARLHVRSDWHRDEQGRYKIGRKTNAGHCHGQTDESIREAQMRLRQQAASQNPLPTRQAIANVRENMPFEAIIAGPSSSSLARNYRNYVVQERGERGDDQLDLADTAQIQIPENLRANFVIDGFVDNLRMLVFATESGRNLLARFGQHAAIDGTQFLENEQQRIKIKSLFALAYVPPGGPLYNHFCLLLHDFPNDEEVEELVHYLILNWIGCQAVMEVEPIDEFDQQAEYGAYGFVDQHIRNWIQEEGFQNRRALFPMNIWNMCERLQDDLVRTNNSVEAWHRNLNSLFRSQSPRLSEFLRVIRKEDQYWQRQMAEYEINPAFGVRGKGMKRKQLYIEQDENLREIFATRADRHPLQYLRAIAYRMPDPL